PPRRPGRCANAGHGQRRKPCIQSLPWFTRIRRAACFCSFVLAQLLRRQAESRLMKAGKAGHTFAQRIFFAAAIYGLVALVPQYFMEERLRQVRTWAVRKS